MTLAEHGAILRAGYLAATAVLKVRNNNFIQVNRMCTSVDKMRSGIQRYTKQMLRNVLGFRSDHHSEHSVYGSYTSRTSLFMELKRGEENLYFLHEKPLN